MTTEEFIALHRNDDTKKLALTARHDDNVDMDFALTQIDGWQRAKTKLPQWAATTGVVYPPHLSMEQCSSECTATYKAALAQRLTNGGKATSLTDLTGGFGVDFSFMAKGFERACYVERNSALCDIARHNLKVMHMDRHTAVMNAQAEEVLQTMERQTMIFIDPARRNSNGGRTFAIADCTPDVTQLRNLLLEKGELVLVKLSPMLDWRKAVADLGNCVGEVHIVAQEGECKELLLVLSERFGKLERIFCANGQQVFDFTPEEAQDAERHRRCAQTNRLLLPTGDVPQEERCYQYLYEPDAALMKAACHALVAQRYGLEEIAPNSHLLVGNILVEHFPGRSFALVDSTSMNKKALKAFCAPLKQANISVRNFPLKVAELRKKLQLADGGDTYLFATTLANGKRVLLKGMKVRQET